MEFVEDIRALTNTGLPTRKLTASTVNRALVSRNKR